MNDSARRQSVTRELLGTVVTYPIDVYDVLEAFSVTCPARQHAIALLLTALWAQGDELQRLRDAQIALGRSVALQQQRIDRQTAAAAEATRVREEGIRAGR